MPDPRQPLRRHRDAGGERGGRGGAEVVPGPARTGDLGHPAARCTRGSRGVAGVREEVPHRHLQSRRRTGPHPSRADRTRSRRRMATPRGDGRHPLPERPTREERTTVRCVHGPHARRTPTGMPVPTRGLPEKRHRVAGSSGAVDDDHRRHRHPHRTPRQPRLPRRAWFHRPRSRTRVGTQQSVADPAHRSSDPRRETRARCAEPRDRGMGTNTEKSQSGVGLRVGSGERPGHEIRDERGFGNKRYRG